MLTVAQADNLLTQHLSDQARIVHSRVVAHVLNVLAGDLRSDVQLWEAVGLVHDLDFEVTAADRSQHGLQTIAWLGDALPPEARDAIAAHDHRTGVESETLLADMLKAADAITVMDADMGRDALLAAPWPKIQRRFAKRPYLCQMVLASCARHDVPVADVIAAIADAPRQV